MKKLLLLVPAFALFFGLQAFAHSGEHGHDHSHSHMEDVAEHTEDAKFTVDNAYSFATTSVQKNGAAFMKITNNTTDDVRLTSVKSDTSKSVELHTMSMDNDIMMMRKVESFEIKAGETFELTPSGNHIMLIGLKDALTQDSSFTLTLSFDNGHSQDIPVNVVIPGTTPGHDHHGHKHSHDDGIEHDHGHDEGDKDHNHKHDKKHDDGHAHDHSHH